MANRKFFFFIFWGPAVFVYLIGSFLIASFNIALWQNEYRFFAVVIYLFLLGLGFKSMAQPEKSSKSNHEDVSSKG